MYIILLLLISVCAGKDVLLTDEESLLHVEDVEEPDFELNIPDGENPLLEKKPKLDPALLAEFKTSRRAGRTTYARKTLRANEPPGGDMKLTEEQRELLFGDINKISNRTKRAGIPKVSRMWPAGLIPYAFKRGDFDRLDQQNIREAMDIWERETCIRFEPWNPQRHGPNHILLQDTGDGCYSYLGLINEGGQTVSLQFPGCRVMGTYLHELGHAIGLVHEHQMPNRDKFVRYFYTNVDAEQEDQLQKYNPGAVHDYGSAYDLSSIMHYELDSFSVDEVSHTMAVNNPWHYQYIGRTYSNILSFGDVKMVNKLYKCMKRCRITDFRNCPAPGFINEDCKCVSPANYYSRVCTNDKDIEAQCYDMAKRGECDPENSEHHLNCAKACDFCPRFLPGVSGIVKPPPKCENVYVSNKMCQLWAANGDCARFPLFMHRYCRLSCQACNSHIGACPNYESNNDCDNRASLCKSPRSRYRLIKYKCPDSCNACWQRPQGDCENELEDSVCEAKARNYACEVEFFFMYKKCAKTCNRCWYEAGDCENTHTSEEECKNWAVMNRCQGGQYQASLLAYCPKTCGTC